MTSETRAQAINGLGDKRAEIHDLLAAPAGTRPDHFARLAHLKREHPLQYAEAYKAVYGHPMPR